MRSVREEFSLRAEEVDILIAFISDIETNLVCHRQGQISVKINPKLKSSVVLMLYNTIESTLTKTLTRLHEKINQESIQFSQANKELRQLMLGCCYALLKEKGNTHSFAINLEMMFSKVFENSNFKMLFSDINSRYKLYSGNIDAKLIRKIFKMHGISFDRKSEVLRDIKKYRNQLAHGERTFDECGRELPLERLRTMSSETSSFINSMIDVVEQFHVSRNFLTTLPESMTNMEMP